MPPAPPAPSARLTARLPLGATGLAVSPLCLGPVDDPDAVLAAVDAGINFFLVTADYRWPRHAALREGLRRLFAARPGSRDEVVIAGAGHLARPVPRPVHFSEPFHDLCAAIPGLARLDVIVAGAAATPDLDGRRAYLAEHRATGFLGARAAGAAFASADAAAAALAAGPLDVLFVRAPVTPALAGPPVFAFTDRADPDGTGPDRVARGPGGDAAALAPPGGGWLIAAGDAADVHAAIAALARAG